jgi:hypothetical protein
MASLVEATACLREPLGQTHRIGLKWRFVAADVLPSSVRLASSAVVDRGEHLAKGAMGGFVRYPTCCVCGSPAPPNWDDVWLYEGRRVVACGECGAHFRWGLNEPRLATAVVGGPHGPRS